MADLAAASVVPLVTTLVSSEIEKLLSTLQKVLSIAPDGRVTYTKG
ncbi:MAG: hypothetical protein WEB60_13550 [Terrimicrobiaceae bacterium]